MHSRGNISGNLPRSVSLRVHFRLCLILLIPNRRESIRVKAFSLLLFLWAIAPKFAVCQTPQEQIEQSFRAGQQALQRGEFARATAEFKRVLALDPNLLEAEVNLGLAYQSLFEYDLAVRHLTKALRQRPNLVGPTVIVGMDYLKLGSPQKAIPFLQHALKLDPSSREAHQALASAYLGQENFRSAAEEFRQIAELDSDKSEAWFRLGHEYLDLAARLAYRGAHLYQDSAWGHRFLGDLLLQRSRAEDAAKEYVKALSAEPRQLGLHASVGQAYLRAGKLEEAEVAFQKELQVDPESELAWLGLASMQLAKGQAPAALESIQRVWEISPEFLVVQREFPSVELSLDSARASLLVRKDEREGPVKDFLLAARYAATSETGPSNAKWKSFQAGFAAWRRQNATKGAHTVPDSCEAHRYSRCVDLLQKKKQLTDSERLLLGKMRFALQQYEFAADVLAQVQGVSNENAEASYWLERTYQALGADAYARLQESFPNSWRTQQLRAEGHAIRRDVEDAIKDYRLALKSRPGEAELHEALGELYLDNHSDEEAQAELEKAVSLDPSRAKALYLLGRLYVTNRENEKAVPYLKRALRLQPNLNEANGLLGTAYVRLGQFAEAIPSLQKAAPLDHFGNVHYQLSLAYRKLGQTELAQKALARSQELRRNSLERDQALILGSPPADSEP